MRTSSFTRRTTIWINKDWKNPYDPDAEIMKMEDSRTHLARKGEQAVDMSGAVLAVTLHEGAKDNTKSLPDTLEPAKRFMKTRVVRWWRTRVITAMKRGWI